MKKAIGNVLVFIGVVFISIFIYQLFQHEKAEKESLEEAKERIIQGSNESSPNEIIDFKANDGEAFATLEIPKLGKVLPIVEGTDSDALAKGVGHLSHTVYPGQNEQIVLSGHRDTVFRSFGEIEIGDQFIVTMPHGTYTYEIKETEIVPEDDTSVIRNMGEEVLVVTTCYPFHYVGNAPDRYVTYAYPVK